MQRLCRDFSMMTLIVKPLQYLLRNVYFEYETVNVLLRQIHKFHE